MLSLLKTLLVLLQIIGISGLILIYLLLLGLRFIVRCFVICSIPDGRAILRQSHERSQIGRSKTNGRPDQMNLGMTQVAKAALHPRPQNIRLP